MLINCVFIDQRTSYLRSVIFLILEFADRLKCLAVDHGYMYPLISTDLLTFYVLVAESSLNLLSMFYTFS